MLIPGLVSVTFRQLAPREIVRLAAAAGLQGIEWGGDIHVPYGDLGAAREARALTEDVGLRVVAYGSYFRFRPEDSFEPVLETALALGAPLIRVWAGNRPSADADAPYRAAIAAESRRIAGLAASAGVSVAFEFHDGTLTDTLPSALELLQAAEGMQTLWQPPHDMLLEERLSTLRAVLPWLTNVHAFSWRGQPRRRLPLAGAGALWQAALETIAQTGREHAVLLEFVNGDDPHQLARDAATLNHWLQAIKAGALGTRRRGHDHGSLPSATIDEL